jgi:hypothetical protein
MISLPIADWREAIGERRLAVSQYHPRERMG